jgi:hypothetical protein
MAYSDIIVSLHLVIPFISMFLTDVMFGQQLVQVNIFLYSEFCRPNVCRPNGYRPKDVERREDYKLVIR